MKTTLNTTLTISKSGLTFLKNGEPCQGLSSADQVRLTGPDRLTTKRTTRTVSAIAFRAFVDAHPTLTFPFGITVNGDTLTLAFS